MNLKLFFILNMILIILYEINRNKIIINKPLLNKVYIFYLLYK